MNNCGILFFFTILIYCNRNKWYLTNKSLLYWRCLRGVQTNLGWLNYDGKWSFHQVKVNWASDKNTVQTHPRNYHIKKKIQSDQENTVETHTLWPRWVSLSPEKVMTTGSRPIDITRRHLTNALTANWMAECHFNFPMKKDHGHLIKVNWGDAKTRIRIPNSSTANKTRVPSWKRSCPID